MSGNPPAGGHARGTPADIEMTLPRPLAATGRWTGASVLLLVVLLLVYGYLLARTAWLCDDAYISFRTIDNLLHGYGLTWNADERVQAYTHPLWLFLLAAASLVTGEIPTTAMYVSMVVALAAVLILALAVVRSVPQALVCLVVLIFSKAFVDYSTSGLENPLSHLLLALFFVEYLRPRPRIALLALLAALGMLSRMDMVLIFGPLLAWACWSQRRWAALGQTALGFLPFVAWEIFSLLYYGFPFPNTAYAKLNTGSIPGDLVAQGLRYLLNSLRTDPLTLPFTAAVLLMALYQRDRRGLAVLPGVVLYLVYVVKIGGDFMSGRFLTIPFFAAVLLLAALPIRLSNARWLQLALLAACAGFWAPYPSLLSTRTYGLARADLFDSARVTDERGYYYPVTGLRHQNLGLTVLADDYIANGRILRDSNLRVVAQGSIGMLGFIAGPTKHIIDMYALSDPLLARLPRKANLRLAIGHFTRHVPDGYVDTVQSWLEHLDQVHGAWVPTADQSWSGINQIADPNLGTYYDRLCLITRGPLFDRQRLIAILRMNLGRYDALIDREFYRYPPERLYWRTLTNFLPPGAPIVYDVVRLPKAGAIIVFDGRLRAPRLAVPLDGPGEYRIAYPRPKQRPLEQAVPPAQGRAGDMALYVIDVPADVVRDGYDRVRIYPVRAAGDHRIGHIQPLPDEQPPR